MDVLTICKIATGGLDCYYRRLDWNTDQLSSCHLPVLWHSHFRNGCAVYATLHTVTVKFTLQQWLQLSTTISNTITDTHTHLHTLAATCSGGSSIAATAAYYATVMVTFTSSNIMYNNRHKTHIMSACCKTMKMKNSQMGVYIHVLKLLKCKHCY